jgi:transcriptional regulator MraZ
MFLGEYQHSLDAKGRVILPARYREELAGGAYVTKGRGGCLFVYAEEEFEQVAERARELSRRGDRELETARTFFAGAAPAVPDKQGRVAIPQHLREFAGLEKDVVVAGVFSRVEIWDSQRWRERERQGDQHLTASTDLPDFGI